MELCLVSGYQPKNLKSGCMSVQLLWGKPLKRCPDIFQNVMWKMHFNNETASRNALADPMYCFIERRMTKGTFKLVSVEVETCTLRIQNRLKKFRTTVVKPFYEEPETKVWMRIKVYSCQPTPVWCTLEWPSFVVPDLPQRRTWNSTKCTWPMYLIYATGCHWMRTTNPQDSHDCKRMTRCSLPTPNFKHGKNTSLLDLKFRMVS